MHQTLTPYFRPRGVAIIGASSNPTKLSFGIFQNLTQYGYKGGIYPVNPNSKEILGLPCYPDVSVVPDPVDLAVIVVGAASTPAVIDACGKRGIRAVTVISGGFREVGEAGKELENRCLEIARHHHMRMVGPNCVGTMDLHSGLNTTFIYGVPDTGHIGFLSQSGAICGGIVDIVKGKRIGFSNFVSLGNMADVNETDMIEFLAQDDNTRVITLYLEGLKDGSRFLEVAGKVTRQKPIIILKAGKTSAGSRAVSSHTGSIAGSHAAYAAAFKQAGIIEVQTVSDLFDVALAFDLQPLPLSGRVAIVTNSGGPAALTSDSLGANGLNLATLGDETQDVLRLHLNPSAQVGNPVDMLGGAEPSDYGMAMREVGKDTEVDAVVPILVPQALIDPVNVAREIVTASKGFGKTTAACMMGDRAVLEAREVLHSGGVPLYTYPETVGVVLGAMIRYSNWIKRENQGTKRLIFNRRVDIPDSLLSMVAGKTVLEEAETRQILQNYDIPLVEGILARTPEEAGVAAEHIGGAVALKVVSPQIVHKSDVGGIRLGLVGANAVEKAYSEITHGIARVAPDAVVDGVMVEKMAPKGQEVIVGMRKDPAFGPVIMFGLGGTFVELFSDVAFRIVPFDAEEARQMILETRTGKLLSGYRGEQPGDIDAVVDVIQKLGDLALDWPVIQEIEINPLVVYPHGQGCLALDCRAITRSHS